MANCKIMSRKYFRYFIILIFCLISLHAHLIHNLAPQVLGHGDSRGYVEFICFQLNESCALPLVGDRNPFQRELHILTKPSLLRKEGCNRPPVLRTATL